MLRPLLAASALVTMTATARAETVELGAVFLAASETSSAESAGHVGAALNLAVWSERIGGVLEAGRTEWGPEALKWVGIGARVSLLDPWRRCPPHEKPGYENLKVCLGFRPWVGGGIVHEEWAWETFFGDDASGRFERNAYHVGAGFDVIVGGLSSTLFFRVQRGRVPDGLPIMDMADPPYETSLVLGLGLGYVGN